MAITKDPSALAAGDLRHLVTFLQSSITSDVGGNVETWNTYSTARAKIDPIRALDLVRTGQDTTQTFLTVSIRNRDDVNSTMRLQYQNSVYVIQGIENILQKNRVLRLTCLGIGQND